MLPNSRKAERVRKVPCAVTPTKNSAPLVPSAAGRSLAIACPAAVIPPRAHARRLGTQRMPGPEARNLRLGRWGVQCRPAFRARAGRGSGAGAARSARAPVEQERPRAPPAPCSPATLDHRPRCGGPARVPHNLLMAAQ